MQRVEVGDAVDADDTAAARRRMGAHARVAPRAELLAARIRIDLELAAQASFRAVFMSDMGQTEKNSVGAYVFRFALELGHCSTQSACLKRANNGRDLCWIKMHMARSGDIPGVTVTGLQNRLRILQLGEGD